jgi:hypothetical protein
MLPIIRMLYAVRSLSPPAPVEPSGPPHPKSYMEVVFYIAYLHV